MGNQDMDDIAAAERDRRVVEMRKAGITWPEIADLLGITMQAAHACFRRGVAAIPSEAADEMRVLAQGRQDFVTREMIRVMTQFHPLVNQGRVIVNPATGEIVEDPMPKIAAAKILMTVDEQFARMFGLHAPKTSVTIAIDAIDAEIRRLEAELGEDLPKGPGGAPRQPRERPAIEPPPSGAQGYR